MDYEEIKPVKVKICTLDEMPNFESLACVCGLSFPETANEFQKAMLTLSHMMAALRESILRGSMIPVELVEDVTFLASVAFDHKDEQK